MLKNIRFKPFTVRYGSRLVAYDRPAVMGILNATPDSFYDGGSYLADNKIVERAEQLYSEGADILDIGVVSSRPGAQLLSPEEEEKKLRHVVKVVRKYLPEVPISVDTCFALPARAAVDEGADMVNDISGGLLDNAMFPTVAELRVPYVLMHNQFTDADVLAGRSMNADPHYDDILQAVSLFFSQRLAELHSLGVADVVLDPGFGFAKTLEHNYQLFAQLPRLRTLFPDAPLLVAVSRKSMIYKLLDTTPSDALEGTTALHTAALMAGAQMLRVHDVRAARQVVEVVGRMMQYAHDDITINK